MEVNAQAVVSGVVQAKPCSLLSIRWVSVQNLDIYESEKLPLNSPEMQFHQHWMSALLLGSPNLTSLTVSTDGVAWPPVLGLMSLRHLNLMMGSNRPWLGSIMTDLSFCTRLETLKLGNYDFHIEGPSQGLHADVFLHAVTALKSVEVYNWCPVREFTLPAGCLLRLAMVLAERSWWDQWQRKGCPVSMLQLDCMELRAWPAGIQQMSGLRCLKLSCERMRDQDLAALQHIPHVSLVVEEFSTFLLIRGSWQNLQISGAAGFKVDFSHADAFVRGTKRFLFVCSSQETKGMYDLLRAACMRQRVACHACDCKRGKSHVARLGNVRVCRTAETGVDCHLQLIRIDENGIWPNAAVYPELYS